VVPASSSNINNTPTAAMTTETDVKLAVLIDADNAQPSVANALLAEVAKYGTAYVRRTYGDWTGTSLKGCDYLPNPSSPSNNSPTPKVKMRPIQP